MTSWKRTTLMCLELFNFDSHISLRAKKKPLFRAILPSRSWISCLLSWPEGTWSIMNHTARTVLALLNTLGIWWYYMSRKHWSRRYMNSGKQRPFILRAQSLIEVKIFSWSPGQVLFNSTKNISVPLLFRIDLYIVRFPGWLGQFFRGSCFKIKREIEE